MSGALGSFTLLNNPMSRVVVVLLVYRKKTETQILIFRRVQQLAEIT